MDKHNHPRRRRPFFAPKMPVFWLVLLAMLVLATPAMACPNCKETLASGPNAANLVRGYFWSIMFMMSMPFLILGGVGGYFYYEVRKARARMPANIASSSLVEMT